MSRTIAASLAIIAVGACGDPPTGSVRLRAHVVQPSQTQIVPDSSCFRFIVNPGDPRLPAVPPFETRPDLNDPHIQQCS